MRTWIFQANPDTFDVTAYLNSAETILWTVPQAHFEDRLKVGDRVFLWRAAGRGGVASGVIAESVLVEEPSVREVDPQSLPYWVVVPQEPALRVRLRVVRLANDKELIRREWLKQDPVLAQLRILRLASETNYAVPEDQAHRLAALWRNTGRDWNRAETIAGLWAYSRTYGGSVSMRPGSPVVEVALRIGRATQGVYNKVMNFRALDPRDERDGFSGGGGMAAQVWGEFFDTASGTLRAYAIEAEYHRAWDEVAEVLSSPKPHQPTLRVVEDAGHIAAAYAQLAARLCDGAAALGNLSVGFRGGHVPAEVFYRADLDLWMAFGEAESRYWTAYGFGEPGPRTTPPIITEINPPRAGIQRGIAGAFAEDAAGDLYLVHRGKVGGGRKGISKAQFLPYFQHAGGVLESVSDGARISDVIVVGALVDEKLPAHVAGFVHSVAEFKTGATLGGVSQSRNRTKPQADITFAPEFEGRKQYLARERVTADCTHGTIVNSLQRLLAEYGYETMNDQHRDLLIVDSNGTHRVLFEVKPSAQLYLIYQAVGQLLFHTAEQRNVRRIAVLPSTAPAEIRSRLAKLGIGLVSFEWEGQKLRFDGLEPVMNSRRSGRTG